MTNSKNIALNTIPPGVSYNSTQEPFCVEHQITVPVLGQVVFLYLPSSDVVNQTAPLIPIHGSVVKIYKHESITGIFLEELEQVGLSYPELCALINTDVIGFHYEYESIEGKLIGLYPAARLAGIQDTDPNMIAAIIDHDDPDDEPPVVWAPFTTILPKHILTQNI